MPPTERISSSASAQPASSSREIVSTRHSVHAPTLQSRTTSVTMAPCQKEAPLPSMATLNSGCVLSTPTCPWSTTASTALRVPSRPRLE